MKKKLGLAVLAVLLIVGLGFTLANRLAAAPTSIVVTPSICTFPAPTTWPVTITGNGITNPMTVVFADPNITVNNYGNFVTGSPGSFTCDINLAAGTTDGPKEFTITDSGSNSILVYNRFFKARLPDPPGATISFVGLSIQPFWDLAGTNPVITPVAENNIVYYKLSLSVSANTDFNFFGGELGVQFPDGSYHLAAGYGALTPGVPQIPEVSLGNSFVVVCPDPYTVHAVDRTPSGFLLAKTAYGPNGAIAPTQIYGIQEATLSPTNASAYVEYNLNMFGELQVTKAINLNGAGATGVTSNFSVTVTGTGGPFNHTFQVIDGVVQSPNPWILSDLSPGFYIVSESSPAPIWTASGGGLVQVFSGNFSTSTITNTLNPGNLQVTKAVNLSNVVNSSAVSQNFTVTVTGPSFPGGTSHVFKLENGVLANLSPNENPWMLSNLMPGAYNVSEAAPGSTWSATGGGGVTVNPSQTANSTVTNTYLPGELEVTKIVDLNNVVNAAGISQDFVVTVTGPSYPGGTSHTFKVVAGVLINVNPNENPWILNNLIPGGYTVNETDPGTTWSVTGGGGVTVNPSQIAFSTVTNDYLPGNLQVTKAINLSNVVNSTAINQDFTVTVTGPSYPGGTSHTFKVVAGVLINVNPNENPWVLSNLIPGAYNVSEAAPGSTWSVTGGGGVTVNPSQTSNNTVTNTYLPGNLEVTKAVNLSNVVNAAGISQDFVVTVTGPSYPGGTSHTFKVVAGVLINVNPNENPWVLSNLIPGAYNVSEAAPGSTWSVTGGGGVTVNPSQTSNNTVTNTYLPGNLEVTKAVNLSNVVNAAGISQDFVVTVTGPSYPGGTSHTFKVVAGVLINVNPNENPWILNNLIPGGYTVNETDPGTTWSVTGGGGVTVNPSQTTNNTVTNTYLPGNLQVTKAVNLNNVVNAAGISQDFVVTVTGPSYPGGTSHTFKVLAGVLVNSSPNENPWVLSNLISGNYTVTESDPGVNWAVSGGGVSIVNPSATTNSTVTNDFLPGNLQVTKAVNLNNVVNAAGISQDFVVTVTGPSYPGGTSHTFKVVAGVLINVNPNENPWVLSNLIPGAYNVSEAAPGSTWSVSGGGGVTVNPSQTTNNTVTNTYLPGNLEVTKAVNLSNVVNAAGISQDFVVTVTGPSYPGGTSHTFKVVAGVLINVNPNENPWVLSNLIPGAYNVSEAAPGSTWSVSGGGGVTVNPSQTSNNTVTNTYLPGNLEVTKAVNLNNVVNAAGISQDFVVTVTGPSYPGGTSHTFKVVAGVLINVNPNENPWVLSNLIPGAYNVSEAAPGSTWSVTGGGGVTVNPSQTSNNTVTNTYLPGNLEVTKAVNLNNVVNAAGISQDFVVTVTGPSYPGGTSHTFKVVAGVLINVNPNENPWVLSNLIPGAYNVSEAAPGSTWSVTGGGGVTVNPSQTSNNTVTNTYLPGNLEVTKAVNLNNVVNAAGISQDFVVTVTGPSYPGGTSHTFKVVAGVLINVNPNENPWVLSNLIPGAYNVSEAAPGSTWSVTGGGGVTVNPSQTSNNTVTNTYLPGNLEVTKAVNLSNVVNAAGISQDFVVTVTGPSYPGGTSHTFKVVAGVLVNSSPNENPWVLSNLIPGAYNVSEAAPGSTWSVTGGGGVTVNPSQTTNNTVTNTYLPGNLQVTKAVNLNNVVNAAGISQDFVVTVTGPSYPGGTSHTFKVVAGVLINVNPNENPWVLSNLIPGAYNVSEASPGSTWSVSGGGGVTVNPSQTSNNTVTNTYLPGNLEVTKVVNLSNVVNAAGISQDFVVTVTGPSYPGGTSHTFKIVAGVLINVNPNENPWVLSNLIPGAYNVSEAAPGSTWSVSGGGGVTVNPSQTSNNTVTNTYLPGNLQVTKAFDLHGAGPTGITQDFTVTVTGPSYPGGTSHVFNMVNGVIVTSVGHENPWTLSNLISGNYTVAEASPGPNWSVSGGGQVVVNPSATTNNTVTNDFLPGNLQVTKALILHGAGPAGISGNFSVTVTGTGGPYNHTFVVVDGVVTPPNPWVLSNLIPGVYTVTESNPGPTWLASGGGGVTVNPGTTANSTVTNDYQLGNLQVTKAVNLQGAGPAGISGNFSVTVTGTGGPYNHTFEVLNGVVQLPNPWVLNNLQPGSYNVTEANPGPNWVASGGGGVTVSPGATSNSTVTNTFQPGNLQVTKAINLQGAGPSGITQDFVVTVTGPSYPGGTSHTFKVVNGVLINVNPNENPWLLSNLIPGAYTVSEASPGANWVASGGGGVTVNPGATANSTVTNTFQPGSLQVTKAINLQSAGPGGISQDFVVTVTGPSYPGGTSHTFKVVNGVLINVNPNENPWLLSNLIPGAYTVSEASPGANWVASGGGGVTVNPGATANSTVTNTFQPGSLQVTKAINLQSAGPGGISQDFVVTVTGPSYPGGTSHTFKVVNGVLINVNPNENPWLLSNLIPGAYTVSEANPGPNWVASGGGGVTVNPGATANSTVTNTFQPGNLQVTKVVNLNGASPTGISGNFSVTVTGTGGPYNHTFVVVNGVVQAPNPWVLTNLIPGAYTVSEANPGPAWAASGGGGVTVNPGSTANSTVTNTLNRGSLTVTKLVVLNGVSGIGVNKTFSVLVTGPASYSNNLTFVVINGVVTNPVTGSYVLTNLIPGVYTITETPGANWIASGTGNVTVNPGAGSSISVTNTFVFPNTTATMTFSNTIVPANGGPITITLKDTNTGNVPLHDNHMHFKINPVPSGLTPPAGLGGMPGYYLLGNILQAAPYNVVEIGSFSGESISADGIMQMGETWTWTIVVNIPGLPGSYDFIVDGHGTDPYGTPINGPDVPSEHATGRVSVPPPVPGSSNLGLGVMIAALATFMIYLTGRRVRNVKQIR